MGIVGPENGSTDSRLEFDFAATAAAGTGLDPDSFGEGAFKCEDIMSVLTSEFEWDCACCEEVVVVLVLEEGEPR
jgi:hypothetical protein